MAEEQDTKKVKKPKGDRLPAGTRAFYKPKISLVRLGREVGLFRGEVGTINVEQGILEFIRAETTVGGAVMKAGNVQLNMGTNRLLATGQVTLEEGGVSVNAERLVSTPVLTGLVMKGRVHLKSENREAAEELLKTHRG
jgi:hypothetical protein